MGQLVILLMSTPPFTLQDDSDGRPICMRTDESSVSDIHLDQAALAALYIEEFIRCYSVNVCVFHRHQDPSQP